jgi:RNA polymerase sigma-70 factor (ECF subfamily)
MEPAAASPFIASALSSPAAELQDFERVVQVYWPRIFRFVLASVQDTDAAETLTQDCFLKAYHARSCFRGEASVNTWLMRIAVNLVRDFGRNRRLQFWMRTRLSALETGALAEWLTAKNLSPEEEALVKDELASVWAASESLSDRQRTVFLLRFVEDMDLLEIAAATGLTEGAVKTHLFRALQKIRERVKRLQ